jgi:hypothetical protein
VKDLYRTFRETREAHVDLAEIDGATDRMCVTTIKNRQLRTVSRVVEKLLERHHLEDVTRLSEDKESSARS